ncbi:hypothetical protein L6452_29770 [Arctium lappa]|uniref:Uncharacterized protein n=1 Tax=Arctium lappa TaxID=4217 RepID=A0ACB8ZIA2_ARCLA|nr:hypothetical protein L6452_29770 [Arctium lappa]
MVSSHRRDRLRGDKGFFPFHLLGIGSTHNTYTHNGKRDCGADPSESVAESKKKGSSYQIVGGRENNLTRDL